MFRINDCVKFEGKEYVISDFLGRGGMGDVFSIKEKTGESQFALKFLQNYLPDDNNHRSLINEWEKAQKILHKNTIRYYGFHDGLTEPNTPYIIMELARDGSLEQFLKNQSILLEEDVCFGIFHQIIDGMEAVNEVLVHRDIKPDNIFIDNGIFKIADFGLAKVSEEKTRTKTFKGWGTEPYIAPEAYRSEKNTIQMDMYSIGHVFYRIAALKHAFGFQKDWEQAHLTCVAPALHEINPNISPKVASVINKLISKRPVNRYKTWDCVRKDLIGSAQNVGNHRSAIDKILRNKILKDLETEAALSVQQTKEKELKRKNDILNFQFSNEIIQPLADFVDNFNRVSGSSALMNISGISGREDLTCKIIFEGKVTNIWFHPLTESDVINSYKEDIWGVQRVHTTKPSMRGKSIMAWGGVECADKTGINIILVSSDDDEYGDWYLLKNTHSGLARHRDTRPDPFAFKSNELVEQIHYIGVMHIYKLDIKPLNTTELIDFVSASL